VAPAQTRRLPLKRATAIQRLPRTPAQDNVSNFPRVACLFIQIEREMPSGRFALLSDPGTDAVPDPILESNQRRRR
jgi:hypothetical protein